MRKFNHKLVSTIFSVITIVLFSLAALHVAYAQSPSDLGVQRNAELGGDPYPFTHDLTVGSSGNAVKALQVFLNSHGAQVSVSGLGAPGNETTYFGRATKAALLKWQTANGIFPASGYFGPKSKLAVVRVWQSSVQSEQASSSIPTRSDPVTSEILQNAVNAALAAAAIPDLALSAQVRPEFPVRLKIPQIAVDSTFEYVGLTAEGAMDVPKGPNNVAWFQLGPRPGETGSAIVAGHYGWKNNTPAVFDNLGKLHKGDKLYIQDNQGVTTTFVVREIRAFGEHDDASSVFGSSDGGSHLNLITCGGVWNAATKSYSNRLVVFSDKEMQSMD